MCTAECKRCISSIGKANLCNANSKVDISFIEPTIGISSEYMSEISGNVRKLQIFGCIILFQRIQCKICKKKDNI